MQKIFCLYLICILVNRQLVCLPPVGILNLVMFIYTGPENPQWGVANYVYIYIRIRI